MSWFDGLLSLLERMPTERLTVMRDVLNALVERRRQGTQPTHDDIESAVMAACAGAGSAACYSGVHSSS